MKRSHLIGVLMAAIFLVGIGLRLTRGGLTGHASGSTTPYAATSEVTGVTDAWTSDGLSSSDDPQATGTGQIFAQAVTYNGTDPGNIRFDGSTLRYQDAEGAHTSGETVDVFALDQIVTYLDARGEAGSVSIDTSGTTTINFASSYYDPVIFLQIASDNGTNPVSVYATSVGESSATIEMSNQNGGHHVTETIDYLVVEAGTYSLSGKVLVVSTQSITTPASGSSRFTNVALGATYTSYALVSTIQSRSKNTGYGGTRIIKSSDYFQARFMRYPDSDADTGTIGFLTYGPGTALTTATPTGCEACPSACAPTYAFGYVEPQVTNALKGDLLFNDDPDSVLSPLFEALDQTYTHAAIFVDDGYDVRHNALDETTLTSSIKTKSKATILLDSGFGNCTGDAYFDASTLQNGLPGTCTMNPQASTCSYDGTDYTFTWDTSLWMLLPAWAYTRGEAELFADQMSSMDMYYRFFAYRDYAYACALPSTEVSDRAESYSSSQTTTWNGTVSETSNPGCMCAGTVAEASSVAGFDGALTTIHTYSKKEVADAAVALWETVYSNAKDSIDGTTGSWALESNCKEQLASGVANQILNCFAYDTDCGSTSDDYYGSAVQYAAYEAGLTYLGAGDFSLTAQSISPDNLIDNAQAGLTYWLLTSKPTTDSGGYGWYATGTGVCTGN